MAVRGVEDAAPYVLHVSKRLPDAGPFVGQNDGRQPAELAHSCGSMPHWGIDRCATPQQRASAPTEWVVEEILAPEGSIGDEAKSVKKRAALLHVLAFCFFDHLFGVLRGERLAAHNERRQFAAQTRSCGYSPRWGEHCSLPSFASLNRGPLLATPQSPRPCPAPRK